jgi:ligand-binding SRPBCC domain-containing protein
MKVYILKREQFVNRPLKEVFSFFERPENLARLTPDALGFKVLTPSPVQMKEGALIDYTIKLFCFPMHWRTVISTYEPPFRFVDQQLKGPYTFWHHTHTFAEREGGTLMTDEVRYVLPYGLLGRIAQKLLVKRQLDHIFDFRTQVMQKIFEGGKSSPDPNKRVRPDAGV